MIPDPIHRYLEQHHLPYEHLVHGRAVPAQRLAAAEHVPGDRVAKPVVVSVDGALALAVVSATHRVDLDALRRASGASLVELVPESAFADRFEPCEAGAEPALGFFGLPLFVDASLVHEPWILMRAGTHEDAIRVDTRAWMDSEHARVVPALGAARA
ncbi:MAG TPA: YbaK/EbsC family protein [Anaeromyxobacteraceae bacterium]|nr:YbaK/EbsC family protein [Anaeromyxobacteraceae bacterium]